MNGILLALACFGAFAAILASEPSSEPPAPRLDVALLTSQAALHPRDPGSMTATRSSDPETGEITEISVIAFRD